MKLEDLVRDNVKALKPFSSARSEFTGKAEVLLDANESPYESDYNRYPDPYQKELKEIIAIQKNIAIDQIILGNGSDEIIDLIVRTFCEPKIDVVRYIYPSFGMYEVVADINDVRKEVIMLDEQFDLDVAACLEGQTDQHKLIFLCSPNNPTGNLLSKDRIAEVIKGWGGIVVVDEAYIDFCDEPSLTDRLVKLENGIILQTFSKGLGGAGLRLGMGFAKAEIISFLNKIKPPYNVNIHTQETAKEILSNTDENEKRVATLVSERERMSEELATIYGVEEVYPSAANFLLVRCKEHMALYNSLTHQGVIVRDRSKLKGCEGCLRFTIGLPEENEKLLTAIKLYYA